MVTHLTRIVFCTLVLHGLSTSNFSIFNNCAAVNSSSEFDCFKRPNDLDYLHVYENIVIIAIEDGISLLNTDLAEQLVFSCAG